MGFAVEELWVMGYDRYYGFYLTITCPPSRCNPQVMGYHSFYCTPNVPAASTLPLPSSHLT